MEAGKKKSKHTASKGGKGSHQSASNGLADQKRQATDHMDGDSGHQGMEDEHKQDLNPLVHNK